MTPHLAIVLRRGDTGPAVADVCDRLVAAGDLADHVAAGLGTDTVRDRAAVVYDERVEQAVRSFQQRRGLIVDGVVGRATYAMLDGARWQLGDRVLQYVPGHLAEGDDVTQLQGRLQELGFSVGKVDGMLGPATDRAVRDFQQAVGLTPDGTVGPETMRAFAGLRRSVSGGSATALREREQIRRGGFSLMGRTVVLDPGHGGADGGAVGHGHVEADLVLDLARRIEGRLTAHGVGVVYTRTSGWAGAPGADAVEVPDDLERARVANDCGADLVLSLHTDHSPMPEAHGIAAFFYGHEHGGWSTIGERFADLLLREVVARTGFTDCRTHARTWPLLRHTRMPAVRLDVGYLTHPGDARALHDPAIRDRIAEGVVVALQRLYLGEADTATTGVLRLADLRRHLETIREGQAVAE